MRTLLIGYDLNKAGQRYDDLLDYLKSDGTWWHHLDSTLLIRSPESPASLLQILVDKELVDGNDEVLIVDVTNDSASWYGFSDSGSEWLDSYLQ